MIHPSAGQLSHGRAIGARRNEQRRGAIHCQIVAKDQRENSSHLLILVVRLGTSRRIQEAQLVQPNIGIARVLAGPGCREGNWAEGEEGQQQWRLGAKGRNFCLKNGNFKRSSVIFFCKKLHKHPTEGLGRRPSAIPC